VRIIGSYVSPYVRKVLVCLHLKGIPYEIDPIVPFMGDDRFSRLSPLRRIPVLVDDAVTLADSSVICQYLEDRHPEPALYPRDVVARARARWLEEWADTRLGDVLIWRLFNQVAIRPFVWGEKTDDAVVQRTLAVDVPDVLGYLEGQVPADGFLFGSPSIADIALACFFRTAAFARFAVDVFRPRARRSSRASSRSSRSSV
jgi:glutathione S-transferase